MVSRIVVEGRFLIIQREAEKGNVGSRKEFHKEQHGMVSNSPG
jgi:hypothetical protein